MLRGVVPTCSHIFGANPSQQTKRPGWPKGLEPWAETPSRASKESSRRAAAPETPETPETPATRRAPGGARLENSRGRRTGSDLRHRLGPEHLEIQTSMGWFQGKAEENQINIYI